MAEMLKHTRVGGRDKAEERRCDMVARTPASVQAGRGSGEAGSTFRHKPGGDKRLWPATDLPLHPHSQPSLSSSAVIKASCVSAGLFFFCFAPILSSALSSSPFSGWVGAVCRLTLLMSEGSPWSPVPLGPPAEPSSTEVIHGVGCVRYTHAQGTHARRCSFQRRGDEDALEGPKGGRQFAVESEGRRRRAAVRDGSLIRKPDWPPSFHASSLSR